MDAYQIIPIVLNGIVVPALWGMYRYLKKWRAEQKKKEEIDRAGAIAMKKIELIKSCKFFLHLGAITQEDKETLEIIYRSYRAEGGNGCIPALWGEVDKLPIDNDIISKYYKGLETKCRHLSEH